MNTGPQAPPQVTSQPGMGLAIASLVLGILAVVLSLFVIGILFGVIGLVLGLIHVRSARGRNGMAWWGVGLSVAGIIFSTGLGLAYFQMVKGVRKAMASSSSGGDAMPDQWQGVLAPDIAVTTLDGETIRLSELKGKRVVLDFWATWCGPCVAEIPHFIKLRNETARDDLVIVGISKEDPEALRAFVKKKGINYPIASLADLPSPYKDVQAIPTTFFIDRKGVVQTISVGSREFAEIKAQALAKDFEGEPRAPASPAASTLTESSRGLKPVAGWSKTVSGGAAICKGDWDGDGALDILVADAGKLHVFGADGAEKKSVPLPERFSAIECGHHKQKGARLLGYSTWGRKVTVVDTAGKELWSYTSLLGVDGAHWGDLDGDGTDEMIVGMNGFGGLVAISSEGKQIWKASLGNVWSQTVIPAGKGRSLVLATEAGGSVRVFDGNGKQLRALKPNGEYCTQIAATVMDQSDTVQVMALGQNRAIAFDASGQVAWSEAAMANPGASSKTTFASGDINGDGVLEWAFLDSAGNLLLVTPNGEKLASLPGLSGVSGFVILPDGKGRGELVTLGSGTLQAYSFQ